jgi:hypothetical protein
MSCGLLIGSIVTKKKKMTASIAFFNGFVLTKWCPASFLWFCCEEGDGANVVTFLYGGVVEKAIVGGDFYFILFFCGVFG